MAKYNVYAGKYVCQICAAEVSTARSYPSEKKITWVCSEKHLSEVSLNTRKTRADFE